MWMVIKILLSDFKTLALMISEQKGMKDRKIILLELSFVFVHFLFVLLYKLKDGH